MDATESSTTVVEAAPPEAPPIAVPGGASGASASEPEQQSRWKETVKRRGLMVGAAAMIAGALARRAAEPAEAVTGGGPDGFFVNGSNFNNTPNSANNLTVLVPGGSFFSGNDALLDVDANSGSGQTNLNAIYGSAFGNGAGVIGECGGTIGDNVTTPGAAGVWGNSLNGNDGVYGSSNGSNGVQGFSSGSQGTGVLGICNNGTSAFGVWGESSTGFGVVGQNTNTGAAGVWGVSPNTLGVVGTTDGAVVPNGIIAGVVGRGAHTGVLGLTSSTTAAACEGDGNVIGVQGVTSTSGGATGYGVKGIANAGAGSAGVLGYAPNGQGYGFYGYSTDPNAAGCLAFNSTSGGQGLVAYNNGGAGANFAAIFGNPTLPHSGNVLVRGVLTQLGGAPTTGSRDASGSLRSLYSVQSPDSWFEDFGHGQLTDGAASVNLDSTFAGLVDTSDYHVFLTPEGATNGSLYVSGKSATGFTVAENGAGSGAAGAKPGAGGGSSGVGFSYRVVAKGKDTSASRFAQIAEPPTITAPAIVGAAPSATPGAQIVEAPAASKPGTPERPAPTPGGAAAAGGAPR